MNRNDAIELAKRAIEEAVMIAVVDERRLGGESVISVMRKIRQEGNSLDRIFDKGDEWTLNVYDEAGGGDD